MELFKNFKNFKNSIALIDADNKNKLSYTKIKSNSEILLKKIKERKFILIIAENTFGSILSYIYSILNNYIVIFINSNANTDEINKIIKIYKPNFIVSTDKKLKLLKKNNYQKIFCTFDDVFFFKTNYQNSKFNDKLQILLPTSGTLGNSKYVKISKENIYENTISIINYLKISKKDIAITNMPYFYSYMLSILNTHLQKGGTIIITNKTIIQKEFWEIYNKYKISSFNGVPYTYEIMSKIGFKRIFRKHLKYITQAGGKLEKNILLSISKLAKKKKIKFFSMYGQTEASPRISYLKPKFSIKKVGSIGKVITNTKMWIQNKSKKIKTPFTKGNIFFSGKNLMLGYANNYKDLNKNSHKKSHNTGDMGYFDKEGFFYITGRSNRYAKLYGNRIDLDEIESKMKSKKLEVVCIDKADALNLFYTNGKQLNMIKKQLTFILKQNLSKIKFILINNFPRTSSLKINYNVLNNLHDKLQ